MTATYAFGRYKLNFAATDVTVTATGNITTSGTVHLVLFGLNRAGYTEPSDLVSVNYNPGDAIAVSFPETNRTTATDFHYYVLCASPTGNIEDAIQIAEWRNYEADQITPRTLTDIVLTEDDHLECGIAPNFVPAVATDANLPNTAIPGMIRVITDRQAFYRYDPYETRTLDNDLIITQPGSPTDIWVKIGSPQIGLIDDATSESGCAQAIQTLDPQYLLSPPPYPISSGIAEGTPIKVYEVNDTGAPMDMGTQFALKVRQDGQLVTSLFDQKVKFGFEGFVNLDTGEHILEDSTGSPFRDLGMQNLWQYNANNFALPDNLPDNHAAIFTITPYFNAQQLEGRVLNNSLFTFYLYPQTQPGINTPGLWQVTGDVVFPEGDRLRCVPGDGLSARILGGTAIVQRYTFFDRGVREVPGISPDDIEGVVSLNGNGSLFYRGEKATADIPTTEAIRCLVSCETGVSNPSSWSLPVAIAATGKLTVTINHDANNDGLGYIRDDYPVIGGRTEGRYNPPYLRVFVEKDGIIYQEATDRLILPQATEEIEILDISNATAIGTLPTQPDSNFSLFEAPVVSAIASTPGTLTTGTYRVAVCLYYDGTEITKISHAPSDGCLDEFRGSLADLFAIADTLGRSTTETNLPDIDLTNIQHGKIYPLLPLDGFAWWDATSTETADGTKVILPTGYDATNPGRIIVSKFERLKQVDSIAGLKAATVRPPDSLWEVANPGADVAPYQLYVYREGSTSDALGSLCVIPNDTTGRFIALNLDTHIDTVDPTGTPFRSGLTWFRKDTGATWRSRSDNTWKLTGSLEVPNITALKALTGLTAGQKIRVIDAGLDYPGYIEYTYITGTTLNVLEPIAIADDAATGRFITTDLDTVIATSPPVDPAPYEGIQWFDVLAGKRQTYDGTAWVEIGGSEGGGQGGLSYKGSSNNSIPIRFWYKGIGSTYSVEYQVNGATVTMFSGTLGWTLYSGTTSRIGETALSFNFSRTSTATNVDLDRFWIAHISVGDVYLDRITLEYLIQGNEFNPWTYAVGQESILEAPTILGADESSSLTVVANPTLTLKTYNANSGQTISGTLEYEVSSNVSDSFRVFLNGSNITSQSGTSGWLSSFLNCPVGVNEFIFEYARVTELGSNLDLARIRKIEIGAQIIDLSNISADRGWDTANYSLPWYSTYDSTSGQYWLRSANLPNSNFEGYCYVSRTRLLVEVTSSGGVAVLTVSEGVTIPSTTSNQIKLFNLDNRLAWRNESDGFVLRGSAIESTPSAAIAPPGGSSVNYSFQYKGTGTTYTCNFLVNGVATSAFSGNNTSFFNYSGSLKPGIHTFAWIYRRSSSATGNGDRFDLKNFNFGEITFAPNRDTLSNPGVNHVNWLYDSTAVTLYTNTSLNANQVASLVMIVSVRAAGGASSQILLAENTALIPTTSSQLALRKSGNNLKLRLPNNGDELNVLAKEHIPSLATRSAEISQILVNFNYRGTSVDNTYTTSFYIDGVFQTTFSGTTSGFSSSSYFLYPGYHSFTWIFNRSSTATGTGDKFELRNLDFGDVVFPPDGYTLTAGGVTHNNWVYDSTERTLYGSTSTPASGSAILTILVDVRRKADRPLAWASVAQSGGIQPITGKFKYIADTVDFNNSLKVYLYNHASNSAILNTWQVTTWTEATFTFYSGVNLLRFEYDKTIAAGADGDVCQITGLELGDLVYPQISSTTERGWRTPPELAWTTGFGTMPDGSNGYYLQSPSSQPIGSKSFIELLFNAQPFNKTDRLITLASAASVTPNAIAGRNFYLYVDQDLTLNTPVNIYDGYEMTIFLQYGGAFTTTLSGYSMGGVTLTSNVTTLLRFMAYAGSMYLVSKQEF